MGVPLFASSRIEQVPARGDQKGLAGPSDAANRVAPNRRMSVAPPMAQAVQTPLTQAPLVPPSFKASSREPSASTASAATVSAVPNAMAKVAATPAQNRPCVSAKMSTRMAPEQGLIPTENTTAAILCHDMGPETSFASTMW